MTTKTASRCTYVDGPNDIRFREHKNFTGDDLKFVGDVFLKAHGDLCKRNQGDSFEFNLMWIYVFGNLSVLGVPDRIHLVAESETNMWCVFTYTSRDEFLQLTLDIPTRGVHISKGVRDSNGLMTSPTENVTMESSSIYSDLTVYKETYLKDSSLCKHAMEPIPLKDKAIGWEFFIQGSCMGGDMSVGNLYKRFSNNSSSPYSLTNVLLKDKQRSKIVPQCP